MAEESTPEESYMEGDISHLGMAAIQVHELFLELKKAGFTHKEALQLAGDVLSSAVVDPYASENDEEEDPDGGASYEMTILVRDESLEELLESVETEEHNLPDEEDPDTIEND